jgi:sugar/nucleoside kinase (ribokinase family)
MRQMILEQVKRVSEAGGSVSFDPNARPELLADPATREAIFEVMAKSAYVLPSTSDLRFLYPNLSEDQALEKIFAAHVKIVALKRGAKGTRIVAQGQHYELMGHTVDEVDPTGAGDCFCGTFLSLITQGVALLEAAEYANAAGAIAVTRRGPMEGNSTREEIALLLKHAAPKTVQL